MSTLNRTRSILTVAMVDAVLLAIGCLIPAMSHVLAWPLYMANPMLALLLVGILVSSDWRNSLALAILLPLVCCLIVGMPTAPKMVCMMAELATVAMLFKWLVKRWGAVAAVFVAIVAGKIVYYCLKAIVIAPAVLVGTDWKVQLLVVLLWGGLFAWGYTKLMQKSE